MVDYEPMYEINQKYSWWRILALISLSVFTTALVFITWNAAYSENLIFPSEKNSIPRAWITRANLYANNFYEHGAISHDFRLIKNQTIRSKGNNGESYIDKGIPMENAKNENSHLVCYYSASNDHDWHSLHFSNDHADLCTHIVIGFANLQNESISISTQIIEILSEDVPKLRLKNSEVKVLLSVGGADSAGEFSIMVRTHTMRKKFLKSMKKILHDYDLDGIDLDWEFPSAYNKERQHFSQLLYEIREEYRREKKNYLLTVAVAAPEGIAFFAYDVTEMNKYVDYVSLMSYDFHFYSEKTPFTGLNAPLFARGNEHSLLGTLNINYSVNWWLANGLDSNKLVVGIPTYGHSFTLVNPFNHMIGAPASGYGRCGNNGFTSYSELCWFLKHNIGLSMNFDHESCSPYVSSGTEWISYENEKSVACKTRYVKANNLGGVMVFSLNTDDTKNYCHSRNTTTNATFPLVEAIKNVLANG